MAKKPGKPKRPRVPNLANQQLNLGKKAAIFSQRLGAVNQNVPGGSLRYKINKKGRVKGVNVELDPAQQEFYDTSTAARQTALEGIPRTPFTMPDDARADAVREASYKRRIGMIEPQLAASEKANEIMMANRGIPIGAEIYNDERERLAQERENLYTAAAQDAELAAGSESDRALAQALSVRNQPFNEYASIYSGAPVQGPSFQSMPGYSVSAPDFMGATMNQYGVDQNAYQQGQNRLWGGLFKLGTAAAGGFGAPVGIGQ